MISGAMTLPRFSGKGQALAGPGFQGPEAASSAFVRQQFQSPPKKYRLLLRWWWPGNNVSDSELRREIGMLDKAGFGGAEIQSLIGLRPGWSAVCWGQCQRTLSTALTSPRREV